MTSLFNPYAEWLQIAGESASPDHYQLLGLRRFEDDPERIRSRYWERFALVRQYQVGAYSETAQRLLDELSQAFQCLSDRASKRRYDAMLGRKSPGAISDDDVLDFLDAATATESEEEDAAALDDLDLPPVRSPAAMTAAEIEPATETSSLDDDIDVVAAELLQEAARAVEGGETPGKAPQLRSRLRELLEESSERENQSPRPGWTLRAPAHPPRRETTLPESPLPESGATESMGPEPWRRISAHRDAPLALAWSPRGDWLATSGDEGRVRIWDAGTGELDHDVALAQIATIDELQWSHDGQRLLLRDGRRISGVWDIAARAAPPGCEELQGQSSPTAWNPATAQLAMVTDGCLNLSVADGWARLPLDPECNVSSLAFAPDGVRIAIAFSRGSILSGEWGLSVRPLAQLLADRFGEMVGDSAPVTITMPGEVERVVIRDDDVGSIFRVATRLFSRLIIYRLNEAGVLEVETAIPLPSYMEGRDSAFSWSFDGRRLAWISDSAVWLRDLVQECEAPKIRLNCSFSDEPSVVAFAPDGVHLAIGATSGELKIWNCDRKRATFSFQADSPVLQLDWRRNARRLAALHANGEVTLWDRQTIPKPKNRAAVPSAVPAKLDLLRICLATEAWEEYHTVLRDLDSLHLTQPQKSLLTAIRAEVKDRAEGALRAALDPKQKHATNNPAFYQHQLRRVVAIDRGAEFAHARKLLEESIKKRGEHNG